MNLADLNRTAVHELLRDAESALKLTVFDDASGNHEIVRDTIASVRRTYEDLLRRANPLIFSDEEYDRFQHLMDRLRASLRFYGEKV